MVITRKLLFYLALALLLTVPVSGQSRNIPAIGYEGLEIVELPHEQGRSNGKKLLLLRVNLQKFKASVTIPPLDNPAGSNLRQFAIQDDIIASFTGGYLASYSPPAAAGLLKQAGEIRNPLAIRDPVMDGVFCVNRSDMPILIARVTHHNINRIVEEADHCIQAGPVLVLDGQPVPDVKQLDERLRYNFVSGSFARAFAGLDRKGRLLLGVSDPINLISLTETLRIDESEGGVGANALIGLSGKSTAGFFIKTKAEPLQAGTTDKPLSSAIVITKKRQND